MENISIASTLGSYTGVELVTDTKIIFWNKIVYSLVIRICRFQNELPKKIEQRGKKAYLEYDELVQAMKWKQTVSITRPFN